MLSRLSVALVVVLASTAVVTQPVLAADDYPDQCGDGPLVGDGVRTGTVDARSDDDALRVRLDRGDRVDFRALVPDAEDRFRVRTTGVNGADFAVENATDARGFGTLTGPTGNVPAGWELRGEETGVFTIRLDDPSLDATVPYEWDLRVVKNARVSPNDRPEAAFDLDPPDPEVGEAVTLDASATRDDGEVVSYAWDVDGDGTVDAEGATATYTHVFGDAGTYDVRLTVTDDDGASDTATRRVTVIDPVAASTTHDVVLAGAPNGLRKYNVTVRSEAEIVAVRPGLVDGQNFQVVRGGRGHTVVVARAVSFEGVDPFRERRALFGVEVRSDVPAAALDVTVHSLVDVNGTTIALGRVQVGTGSPFDGPVPGTGGEGPPTDPDGDGRYEDVDGSGVATFADAVTLAFVDASRLDGDQTAALDFDDDGDVDFDDAVELAFLV
jgi:PKD repeat protein